LNTFSLGDAYLTPDIGDVIQKVGKARLVSTCDLKAAYWQTWAQLTWGQGDMTPHFLGRGT